MKCLNTLMYLARHLNNVWQESLSGSTRTPHFHMGEYFFHNWMRVNKSSSNNYMHIFMIWLVYPCCTLSLSRDILFRGAKVLPMLHILWSHWGIIKDLVQGIFFPPIGGFLLFWGHFWAPECLKSAQNLTKSVGKWSFQSFQPIARMNIILCHQSRDRIGCVHFRVW